MKHYIYIIMCVAMMLTSCDKWPENGKLDGMWQLTSIATDGEEAVSTIGDGIYWKVQLDLIMIHTTHETLNGRTFDTSATFDYKGKSLGAKRIVYSDDGLIFYTEDHYETFEQLY